MSLSALHPLLVFVFFAFSTEQSETVSIFMAGVSSLMRPRAGVGAGGLVGYLHHVAHRGAKCVCVQPATKRSSPRHIIMRERCHGDKPGHAYTRMHGRTQ